jgi:flagellar biosynthesis protein FlhF
MNIKRFQAEDMRTAIRKVREAMGPDAVILSNTPVAGGVEIVAAMDYDESLIGRSLMSEHTATNQQNAYFSDHLNDEEKSRQEALDDIRYGRNIPFTDNNITNKNTSAAPALKSDNAHMWSEKPAIIEMQSELKSLRGLLVNQLSGLAWGQESQFHPLRARLLQRLLALGLSSRLAKSIATDVNEDDGFEYAWRKALGVLAHVIPVEDNPILEHGGVVALVGATGVGKTTTIAKLAARYTLLNGSQSVALITTDKFRVAAHEQLRSYARIMGVPMSVAADSQSLNQALELYSNKGLVLIDTAGLSQRDIELTEQLELLEHDQRTIQTYLTLATNSQRGVMDESADAFNKINLSGCVFTKIDETTSLGGALTTAIEHKLPIAYFCDGQRVPEDIHQARAHSLVSRSVAIMQQVAAGNQDEQLSIAMTGMMARANG